MITIGYVLVIVLVLGGALLAAWPVLRAYRIFRGAFLVICPATGEPAGIQVDARYLALSSAVGSQKLRLKDCSRWPEMAGCAERCLRQLEESPESRLVTTLLAQWYRGKPCALCGRALRESDWPDRTTALRSPGGRTLGAEEVRPEALHGVLRTHDPVCWICHNAQTFRREHPDLVVDRPWSGPVGGGKHA